MATDLDSTFNEQYLNINSKLKKRFMRRPNITEATNEFIALAIQCEHSEQPAFAAQAYVGAAKCEAAAGNILGEAAHYSTAARHYMKAEKKLHSLKFYSPDRENLEAAVGCFMHAMSKYPASSPMSTSLLMEIASDFTTLGHLAEAAAYFEQALSLISDRNMKLMCLRNILNLQMSCEKFEESLDTANAICDGDMNAPEDILTEVQISRILLSLLVEPAEESQPQSLKQLFVDLLNDDENENLPFNTDLKLKLQSLVISNARSDVSSMLRISADAKHLLTVQQADLLDKINAVKRATHLTIA